MRSRIVAVLLSALALVSQSCRPTPGVTPQVSLGADTLSADELAEAMQQGTPSQLSDGTARGDTIAHVAWLGYWHIEGGAEITLGERMIRYALRRGFPKPTISPDDLRHLVICYSEDPQAWKEVAEQALASRRGGDWARIVQQAADSALKIRPLRPCYRASSATRSNDGW